MSFLAIISILTGTIEVHATFSDHDECRAHLGALMEQVLADDDTTNDALCATQEYLYYTTRDGFRVTTKQ